MIKFFHCIAVCAVLTGCVDAGFMADPNAQIELMQGYGGASVAEDGSRSFRHVFPPQAGTDRAHHEAMIARMAARADGCPRGYTITKVESVEGGLVYSGPCR